MTKFEITWLEDKSDEALLAEIRRVSQLDPDQRLKKRTFNAHAKISSSAVEKRFGSWSEAVRKAGLPHALPVYSDEAVISDLQRVSEMCPDGPFTLEFYCAKGEYSNSVIKRRLGGWHNALVAAELGYRYSGPITTERMKSQPGRTKSNEQILQELRDVHKLLGGLAISGAEIAANSDISQSMLYRRFGSVSAALKKAGVEQVNHGRRYTEDEVLENLLNVWTHYGRPPTALEMDKLPSQVGKKTYISRYGGWRKALKAFVENANAEADSPTVEFEPELGESAAADLVLPQKVSTRSAAMRLGCNQKIKLKLIQKIVGQPVKGFDSRSCTATISPVCCAVIIQGRMLTATCIWTISLHSRLRERPARIICEPFAQCATSEGAIVTTIRA
jgi:hypothetical protein